MAYEGDQLGLFGELPRDVESAWAGMPDYEHDEQLAWHSIKVNFRSRADIAAFADAIGQSATETTRSLWFPPQPIGRLADKRWIATTRLSARYPIYIISKGRWESRFTSRALEKIGIPYRIVVEPQEYAQYASVIDPAKVLTLPFSNLGQGSIPARNWVWEHSVSEGAARHWILDDNIAGFYRFHRNMKIPVACANTFRAAEDFVDRFDNVALAGFNYFMFVKRKDGSVPPITLNTRIYSCILIDNTLPFKWRGRYNEDTDLSLRALKAGWCTVLFNAFLAEKQTTMTMKGGNTDELYQDDGRLKMAESLVEQHPDVAKVTWKFNRWQHHVDYRPFKRNKLKPRVGATASLELPDYGMELQTDTEGA